LIDVVFISPVIMPEKEENFTIQQLRLGDEKTYEELYHIYHKRLYSYAFKYLKSRELAEDTVHDTFLKLWEHRQKISTNIKGFLFTTARNHILNLIRNNKRQVIKHIQIEQQRAKSSNKTEDLILYSEYQKILSAGLEQLPQGKRDIFKLKTVQGLTNSEIADQLNITIHTVKSQYYDASKFIKSYLQEHAGIKMKG